jgi:hypothetical protein
MNVVHGARVVNVDHLYRVRQWRFVGEKEQVKATFGRIESGVTPDRGQP